MWHGRENLLEGEAHRVPESSFLRFAKGSPSGPPGPRARRRFSGISWALPRVTRTLGVRLPPLRGAGRPGIDVDSRGSATFRSDLGPGLPTASVLSLRILSQQSDRSERWSPSAIAALGVTRSANGTVQSSEDRPR